MQNLAPHPLLRPDTATENIGLFRPCSPFVQNHCSSRAKGAPGIRLYFESGRLEITVYADEPEEMFRTLCRNVEFRCPAMNLLAGAKVEMEVIWRQEPAAACSGSVE